MMRRIHPVLLTCLVGGLVTCASHAMAANGNGLSNAMRAAGKGASANASAARSLSKQKLSANNGKHLGQVGPGWQRAGKAIPGPVAGQARAAGNPSRILDKRLSQAEHLRQVSEANGNERLMGTADRMEQNAVRNYERRTGAMAPAGDRPPAPAGQPVVAPAAETAALPAARSGFRFWTPKR